MPHPVITAKFFDGKTAHAHTLSMAITDNALIGTSESEEVVLHWQIDTITIVRKAEDHRPAILSYQHDADARLHVDVSLYHMIAPHLSNDALPSITISTSAKSIAFWFALAACIVVAIYQLVPRAAPHIAQHFPKSWEERIGDHAYKLIAGNKKICTHPTGVASLEKIVSRLALREHPAFTDVIVVKSNNINAFAIPGGKMFLFSELIEKAESPEEIASVMAHEMGHIVKNHPTEGLVRNLGLTFIAQLMFGNVGSIGDVGMMGQTLLTLDYSREAEREADQIAVTMLEEHHISPSGLRAFFIRIQKEQSAMDSNFLSYLSTHPATSERIDQVPEADRSTRYRPILTKQEWKELKKICRK